jgi:hypothetical protein
MDRPAVHDVGAETFDTVSVKPFTGAEETARQVCFFLSPYLNSPTGLLLSLATLSECG